MQESRSQYKLDFGTFYNQFYVSDRGYTGNTGDVNFWNRKAYKNRLASAKGVLGIMTGSYGHIKVEVSLIDKRRTIKDFSEYDHVVEGSLEIKSGFIEITDCPTNHVELKFQVKPGYYRVRIYSIDLSKADPDLFDGRDSYKMEIWPAGYAGEKVLKRYDF